MNKKQLIVTWVMTALLLSGCATPGVVGVLKNRGTLTAIFNKHKDWEEKTRDSFIQGKLQLGMSKGQVLYLQGSPNNWSKYKIGQDIYETWMSPMSINEYSTCDFKNGVLIGYSIRGRYYGTEGVDDVRKYE
jgi:outer membrane biogenesis lipoprotein LolB